MNARKWGLLGGGALIALVFATGAFIGVGGWPWLALAGRRG